MKLNIINLIDNFKKFNNYAINQNPLFSQEENQAKLYSWMDILNYTQNCLIFEHKPDAAFKLFKLLLEKRKKGIIFTRNHPDKFRCDLETDCVDMYWLSTEDFDYVIHPWDTNSFIRIVNDFIKKHNHGLILLNGIEYLSTYNDTGIIFNLISNMNRIVSRSKAKFFITIDPIAIGNQFLATMENNSEIVILPSNPFKEVLA